jgi:hypothetical protein
MRLAGKLSGRAYAACLPGLSDCPVPFARWPAMQVRRAGLAQPGWQTGQAERTDQSSTQTLRQLMLHCNNCRRGKPAGRLGTDHACTRSGRSLYRQSRKRLLLIPAPNQSWINQVPVSFIQPFVRVGDRKRTRRRATSPHLRSNFVATANRARPAENWRIGSTVLCQYRHYDDAAAGSGERQRHDGAV